MKVGETKQQFVWKDGRRIPFNVTAVKPKNPDEYVQPEDGQESPEPATKGKPELPKATESK